MSPSTQNHHHQQQEKKSQKSNQPVPFVVPDLTIKDLLSAIPYDSSRFLFYHNHSTAHRKRCFERSAIRSMGYVYESSLLLAFLLSCFLPLVSPI